MNKKIIIIIGTLLLFGCEVYTERNHSTLKHKHETGAPHQDYASEACSYEFYTPYPWSEALVCDDYCCMWEREDFYGVCEETWCYYNDYCGWEAVEIYCYAI